MNYYEPTINDKFNSMVDSVSVIEQLVLDGVRSVEVYATLDRNYKHLEQMLVKQDIIDDGRSLTPFNDAISSGRAFTGLND